MLNDQAIKMAAATVKLSQKQSDCALAFAGTESDQGIHNRLSKRVIRDWVKFKH